MFTNQDKYDLAVLMKNGVALVINTKELGPTYIEDIDVLQIDGIPVLHAHKLLRYTGGHLAAYSNQIGILVDDDFFLLSENAQKFAIYHELAHHKCQHLKRFKYVREELGLTNSELRRKYREEGKLYPPEYEADMLAAYRIGKYQAICALKELSDNLGNINEELKLRIKSLEDNVDYIK